jgi:hypothetical protein
MRGAGVRVYEKGGGEGYMRGAEEWVYKRGGKGGL